MQDKEISPEEAEEALKNSEPTKEGKFAFRKMKTSKKDKADKNKYEGDGVVFKAKLIGVEPVPDARGDKMCQDAMQRLKLNVKTAGSHKKKIGICVSLEGLKIKDEKSGAVMYHHPVSLISFIAQDITDARAFGYIFGATDGPHEFIAIKTEKPAFHVVLALKDLFQTVLDHKKEEVDKQPKVDKTKEIEVQKVSEATISSPKIEEYNQREENIYFEVLLTEPVKSEESTQTVNDLVNLEMTKLQEGIYQMESSIAAAAALSMEAEVVEPDPFDTSFVLRPKRDSFGINMPQPVPVSVPIPLDETPEFDLDGDKYAAFNAMDAKPSVFEAPIPVPKEDDHTQDVYEYDGPQAGEEVIRKSAPAKPPRLGKSPDQSVFADLDPLGKDRPYMDKNAFFQDVKNPPKKVLNDLVDKNKEKMFDVSMLSPSDNNISVSMSDPTPPSTHPSGFPKLPSPPNKVNGLGKRRPSVDNTTVNMINNNLSLQQTSSPITIPTRPSNLLKEMSFSNGSIGSPYSKSPQNYSSDSPTQSDYNYSEGETIQNASPNNNSLKRYNSNGFLNLNANNQQNGVSRPRPRPSLTKGMNTLINGRTTSSHSLSSDSSSDYDTISKESMQTITNVLVMNGHRLRAKSLCIDTNNDYKMSVASENIFAKKNDPFADEFFFAAPKKTVVGKAECV